MNLYVLAKFRNAEQLQVIDQVTMNQDSFIINRLLISYIHNIMVSEKAFNEKHDNLLICKEILFILLADNLHLTIRR